MAVTALTNISGYLKQQYIGPIRKLVNNLSVMWSRLDKTREGISVDGLDLTAKIPTFYEANQGIGWRAEGGTLPTAKRRAHQYMSIASAYVYGRFYVSGQAKAASRGTHSLAKVVTDNMKGMLDELKLEMNRALWGRGTGALARITEATNVADGTAFNVDDASRLAPKMVIDTFTTNAGSGGSAGFDSKEIETVFLSSNEIIMTDDLSGAADEDDDYIYREDSRGYVMMGLEGIIDGRDYNGAQFLTTFQGITRAGAPQYQAFVFDGGGTALRNLEFDLIQQAFEAPEFLGSGKQISCIVSKPDMRRRYFDKCAADKRYVKTLTLDGGWGALEYSGGSKPVPWTADQMCPKNSIYFVNEEEIAVFEAQPMEWLTDQGGGVLRLVSDKDEWEAAIGSYLNVGSFRPNTSSVLRNVA